MEENAIVELYNRCETLIKNLISRGIKFQEAGNDVKYRELEVEKTETCTGSDLHRGFYCPSPVFDLLLGNTNRGRILLKPNRRTRDFHKYFFGKNMELLYIEQPFQTEYLVRDQDFRYGFTFDEHGLCSVAMETFQDGRLLEFICANISPFHLKEGILIGDIFYEAYTYDNIKLLTCSQHSMMLGHPCVGMHEKYQFCYDEDKINGFWFVREDGSFKWKDPIPCKLRDITNMPIP